MHSRFLLCIDKKVREETRVGKKGERPIDKKVIFNYCAS
jgi:hypothetical protein